MKRWLRSSTEARKELPAGYLKTTRFTTPSIQSQEQKNALEVLEVAIAEKFEQFDRMCEITLNLTSSEHWRGTIDEYPEGYYIQLEGTRSNFGAFVEYPSCEVIRKPRSLSQKERSFDVEGEAGTVYKLKEINR